MLQKLLKQKITEQGSISIAEYMETCLYHPEYGYYMTRDPFGKNGDFTTAPEITQLFGEMLALWIMATWQKLGSPEKFNLIECGPGRGTLMGDILRTLKKISPECFSASEIKLIEISPFLQKIQQHKLAEYNIKWHNKIEKVDLTLPTILIGNELLDAFPVQQFNLNGEEKRVCLKNNELSFTHEDDVVEKSPVMDKFLTYLNDNIKNGALLFIDYGYTKEGMNGENTGDTLQAVKSHKFMDILTNCGEADITTHVNFSHVQEILKTENTSIVPLATFLIGLGLPVRAADLIEKQPAKTEEIEHAVYRLLHAEQMGGLFKVLTKIYIND
jgi:SAM-dependent MidA family methyltransferase